MDDEKFEKTHEAMAHEGQSSVQEQRNTQCHFVTYVAKHGYLWELDGRFDAPVCRGKFAEGDHLGIEASKIIQQYMQMNEGDIKFSVMALAPAFSDDFF